MRCDNCGNQYQGNFTCPVCGHHQGSVSHCNVCSTIIYPGIQQCPNCGSPTKYAKKVDVNQKYHSSNTSNNYTKQSNYSAQQYKKEISRNKTKFDKNKFLNNRKKSNYAKTDIKNKLRKFISIIVFVTIAFSFITNIFFEEDETSIVDIEKIEITSDNTDLMLAGNFQQYATSFLLEDDVYIGSNYRLTKTNRQLDSFKEIEDLGNAYLYVEDQYVYYADVNDYLRYNQETSEVESLFTFDKILPIKNHRFLYTNDSNNELYLYNNGTSNRILNNYINYLAYDYQTDLIYYSSGNDYIGVIDLNGSFKTTYDIYLQSQMYVDDGLLYYQDFDGIHCFDTNSNEDTIILEEDVDQFTIVDNGILYTNINRQLRYYNQDKPDNYLISENVSNFNVLGNTVIYEDTYGDCKWYITDYQTKSTAMIPEWYTE